MSLLRKTKPHLNFSNVLLARETGKCFERADATLEGDGARAAFCGRWHAALLPRVGPRAVRTAVRESRCSRGQAEQVSDRKPRSTLFIWFVLLARSFVSFFGLAFAALRSRSE